MTIGDALPGGDQSSLRHLNTRRVLRLLYEGPSLTISGVARVTGLSRPTVQGILTSLVDARLLALDGHDTVPTGGRPAQRYRFAGEAGQLAGLDIGAHAISARVTDLAGRQMAAARTAIDPGLTARQRIDAAVELLARIRPQGSPALWAAGAGSPGIIDDGVVRLSVAIPGWTGIRLAEELGERLGCPVTAMKDANLAVLAEHRVGSAQGVAHVLYVHAGHRLGVGVLVDGRPFTGGSGAAGEIGRHPGLGWSTAPDKLLSDAGVGPGANSIEWVFSQARKGDRDAITAVGAYARALAQGVGAMALAVDPQLIVVGGGIARAGAAVLEPMRSHLADVLYEVPELAISALGDEAVAIGAIEAARDRVRAELFTSDESPS
jgi:predicted NBD/HSP70 family sugar kinase